MEENMDSRSHKLFAGILLEAVRKDISYESWGESPDMDMKFFHRWWRHRFSVMNKIYREGFSKYQVISMEDAARCVVTGRQHLHKTDIEEKVDKNAIALCITSHFYLDIFNGWVFPFGIFYPVLPKNTIVAEVLDDINNPKLVIDELYRLGFKDNFSDKFYAESEIIMKKFVDSMLFVSTRRHLSTEEVVVIIVNRLSTYASEKKKLSLTKKALDDICGFTDNQQYKIANIHYGSLEYVCTAFEMEYCKLMNRMMEGEFGVARKT